MRTHIKYNCLLVFKNWASFPAQSCHSVCKRHCIHLKLCNHSAKNSTQWPNFPTKIGRVVDTEAVNTHVKFQLHKTSNIVLVSMISLLVQRTVTPTVPLLNI